MAAYLLASLIETQIRQLIGRYIRVSLADQSSRFAIAGGWVGVRVTGAAIVRRLPCQNLKFRPVCVCAYCWWLSPEGFCSAGIYFHCISRSAAHPTPQR